MAIFGPLFKTLDDADIRYVVVGGLAVVLHGHARLTVDVDIVIDLDEPEARKAIEALVSIGLRPRIPVDPAAFADRATRESWVRDRGMQVFSMFDPSNPMRVVDLFAEYPVPFDGLWSRSRVVSLPETTVRIASIDDLIRLKRMAGRPQDMADVERLEAIRAAREKDEHE